MMTVHEVSRLTGVSIRALQYYDKIGLLPPAEYTESGYRLYDDASLERLQQILLFRELEFPLKDVKEIVNSPNFDRSKALKQQIELLMLKKEHIENLIGLSEKYIGYRLFMLPMPVFENVRVRIWQNGVTVSRTCPPQYTFYFEHPYMCGAFFSYAEKIKERYSLDKLTTKNRLQKYLK